MPKMSYIRECKSCRGTGIYKGFAEGEGVGVVCCDCRGSGKEIIVDNYTEFTGKKQRRDIDIVFQSNCGIGLGKTSNGGISYKEWFKNSTFPIGTENRQNTCPAWWYQSADSNKKPNWNECGLVDMFKNCKCFKIKEKCWDKFDKEHKK